VTTPRRPRQQLNDAIRAQLADDELAVSWILVVDVAGPSGSRYLSHRAGGGVDGEEPPAPWTALGMGQAICSVANDQMLATTYNELDLEDDADEHG
jgi:hypothetical protein